MCARAFRHNHIHISSPSSSTCSVLIGIFSSSLPFEDGLKHFQAYTLPAPVRIAASLVANFGTYATEEKQVPEGFKMFILTWYNSIASRDIPSQWFSLYSEYHLAATIFNPLQANIWWFGELVTHTVWADMILHQRVFRLSENGRHFYCNIMHFVL